MSVPLRIEIMQRETIKPSSPTPLALRSLKLSLLDQFMPISHITLLLFYPGNGNGTDHLGKAKETSLQLRTSLSEALTLFYPFAGRLRENSSIECDDHGAEYIEARIHCILSDILRKPETEVLKQLLPAAIGDAVITARDSQLLVQASFFDCGGLAIGVNLSHKIADAATLASFIKCWAAAARCSSTEVISSPVFMGASIFPQMDLPIPMLPVDLIQGEAVLKRFVFEAPKITALRAKAISASVPNPTRVESVTALIWKCAMSASRSNLGVPRKAVLSLGVNIRKRLVPALPDSYGGNYVGSISPRMEDHDDLELQGIVSRIRKDLTEFGEHYAKITQGGDISLAICKTVEDFGKMAMSKDIDYYNCTSWCNFELYDADFGWGKPTWLSPVFTAELKNVVCLIDTRDGDGIEAWISLSPEDMALFESNKELLEFSAANPSVSV
ncbi:F21J9.9 [Salix viminalis]|uniref:F21J9.9 n=1 Tax=Salix viminalis TaxID=40686 RepID=A0A9Q0U1B7_SALVM|nr:F21J9.9 [Salix viminalis]